MTSESKKQKLRNNEYYNIQNIFDMLYRKSSEGYNFYKLYELIIKEENILLAYRNLKKNSGSKTKGTDNQTIKNLETLSNEELISLVRNKLNNYYPKSVRRVYIPKANGKMRPLGIPTIVDRLIQQCLLQVLEPIFEAKFYKYSFGFRPNRNTKHAIARAYSLAQINHLHYCIDIDIKGFFDNVDHSKLIKQLWYLGIKDKKILSVLSKMLKAEIQGEGKPNKGTPQGGILSPLLANVVLNELDWWIASQWDEAKTQFPYKQKGNMHVALRNTNLKEMHIVRYADDFKVFCSNENDAERIYHAVVAWIKDRLHLEISEEKSKIVNLEKEYSEFLGIKFKLRKENEKWVIESRICDKAKERMVSDLKHQLKKIKRYAYKSYVQELNSMIIGYHQYYNMATMVCQEFRDIQHRVFRKMENKFAVTKEGYTPDYFNKMYGKYGGRPIYLHGIRVVPIWGIKFLTPMQLGKGVCNYTEEGRNKIHKNLEQMLSKRLLYIIQSPSLNRSVEYNDNRISLYAGQRGKCGILKEFYEPHEMECHHKIPIELGGKDDYRNLIYLHSDVHKLIHSTDKDTIAKYLYRTRLNDEQLKKVNNLRKIAELEEISLT